MLALWGGLAAAAEKTPRNVLVLFPNEAELSGSVPDAVQVTRPVYEKLKDQFVFEPRGTIEVKGKEKVEAWLLRL
jgi:Adenylate and Guanylate cyclase catalytic domain